MLPNMQSVSLYLVRYMFLSVQQLYRTPYVNHTQRTTVEKGKTIVYTYWGSALCLKGSLVQQSIGPEIAL